jgi:hypothetical protein
MSTTTTTIHVYNACTDKTSNEVLMFLQPVSPNDNYMYSAWNVLNPSPNSHQSCELTTTFSASIAALGSSVDDYTDPFGLTLGSLAVVDNPDNQSPAFDSKATSSLPVTADEVGVDNECVSPDTNLSVIWYVNGNQVVQTNNTATTSLNPGYASTFQLYQAVWVMFGQKPTTTLTFTAQTFGAAVKIPIPNGATDVYIKAYTNSEGIDTFEPTTQDAFQDLVAARV